MVTKKKVNFLAKTKMTKTKRPVAFDTKDGPVKFTARRKPERRVRVKFKEIEEYSSLVWN